MRDLGARLLPVKVDKVGNTATLAALGVPAMATPAVVVFGADSSQGANQIALVIGAVMVHFVAHVEELGYSLSYAATMIIFTMYGGGFATIPAYLADIFGTRYVGGIHGRLLTAWSTAGVLGPLAITTLRENAVAGAGSVKSSAGT